MRTTSGRCSRMASTAAAPSATVATTSTSSRMPSISSRASRKTSLSSTSTTRTGLMPESLFRADEERIVRLPALVHLDLDLGVGGGDSLEEAVELGRLCARQEREERARLAEEMLDHGERDSDEVVTTRDRVAVREAEPLAVRDR